MKNPPDLTTTVLRLTVTGLVADGRPLCSATVPLPAPGFRILDFALKHSNPQFGNLAVQEDFDRRNVRDRGVLDDQESLRPQRLQVR